MFHVFTWHLITVMCQGPRVIKFFHTQRRLKIFLPINVKMPTIVGILTFEPPHGKTNNLHWRKQRRRSVTAKLISAFVFATWIMQFLFYLNPKFPVSIHLLCLYSPVCVGPVRKPHCWFSHEAAHLQAG